MKSEGDFLCGVTVLKVRSSPTRYPSFVLERVTIGP